MTCGRASGCARLQPVRGPLQKDLVSLLLVDRFAVEVCLLVRVLQTIGRGGSPNDQGSRDCYLSTSLCLMKRSIPVSSSSRRLASSSVMATERCLPPVQPMPTVK
jgi:hypothetical protein